MTKKFLMTSILLMMLVFLHWCWTKLDTQYNSLQNIEKSVKKEKEKDKNISKIVWSDNISINKENENIATKNTRIQSPWKEFHKTLKELKNSDFYRDFKNLCIDFNEMPKNLETIDFDKLYENFYDNCKIHGYYDTNNIEQWLWTMSVWWKKIVEWIYTNWEKNWTRITWYKNWQLNSKKNYKNWEKEWTWQYMNNNWQLIVQYVYYNDKNENIDIKNRYDNGQLSKQYKAVDNYFLIKTGYYEERYDNWQLKARWNFYDNDEEGIREYWYKNGKMESKWNFKQWVGEWLWKYWYDNWQIEIEWIRKKWDRVWIWKTYNKETGKIEREFNYTKKD